MRTGMVSTGKVDKCWLSEWQQTVWDEVLQIIAILDERTKRRPPTFLSTKKGKNILARFHSKYVIVPTDKAGNNFAIVCKKFYIEQSMKELGIFLRFNGSNPTYQMVDVDISSITKRHKKYLKSKLGLDAEKIPDSLPFLYWIPKMHKKPFSKQRYIAASYKCSTKPASALLTKCFKLIENTHRKACRTYSRTYRINPMWIANNSSEVHKIMAPFNRHRKAINMRTDDFSTLYTNIPHALLRKQMKWTIKEAFRLSKKKNISVYNNNACWTDAPRKKAIVVDEKKLIQLTNWLINNSFVTFGNKCFRQVIGIPMGTDCAPYLANLFLFSLECQWIQKQVKEKKFHLIKKFCSCARYIDDLLLINNDDAMLKVMAQIYPKELVLVPDDSDGLSTPFLDLQLTITNGIISTSIYDKRDNFDFPIVNFPHLCGNIPNKSSYGVFIGEAVRYARGCTYFADFKSRVLMLTSKLKQQSFSRKGLRSAWSRFCESHVLLIQKYGIHVLNLSKKF